MAAFKVGQRVRIIKATRRQSEFVGKETVITGGPFEWFDGRTGYRTEISDRLGEPGVYAEHLAPLLPPDEAADQFISRIKKLGSEPVNDAPKERVTINGDVGNGG